MPDPSDTPVFEDVVPHSAEAELAVLGGLLLKTDAWSEVGDVLTADDFHHAGHRMIFEMMMLQAEADKPIDIVTLSAALASRGWLDSVGGREYLAELAGDARGTANIRHYAAIVRDRAVLRKIIMVGDEVAGDARKPEGRSAAEVLEQAEQKIFDIADGRPDKGPSLIGRMLADAAGRIEMLRKSGASLTGVPTGFDRLDDLTKGWQPANLIVIAARPGVGKTSLAMNLAERAALSGDKPVVVFSLEMSRLELTLRMISSLARIDQAKLQTGDLTDADFNRFQRAATKLQGANLYIDDSTETTPIEIRSRLRRIQRNHGGELGMVVVDYLQLMSIKKKTENRVVEMSEISRSMKFIARDFNCPVIALSQLNRGLEHRTSKRPHMSDLRESGAIEQDADLILLIHRRANEDATPEEESRFEGSTEIILAKHRNGPTDKFPLVFLDRFTRFENPDDIERRYDDRDHRPERADRHADPPSAF